MVVARSVRPSGRPVPCPLKAIEPSGPSGEVEVSTVLTQFESMALLVERGRVARNKVYRVAELCDMFAWRSKKRRRTVTIPKDDIPFLFGDTDDPSPQQKRNAMVKIIEKMHKLHNPIVVRVNGTASVMFK